jgi:HK97 family phage major capsid protein
MEKEKRNFQIEIGEVRAETRTVSATLSSTYPVKRFDGMETLSHEPGAVDLSRAPLPLLCSHNDRMLPVGVVEGLALAGDKLKGTLRFSQNQEALWNDVQDGILRNLSVGYVTKERKRTKGGYTVTKWMPYECSLVAAPADPTVGIGRDFNQKGDNRAMDKNDILKRKKQAVDELAEIAKAGDDEAKMDELKAEIRSLDNRLEAFDMVEQNKGKDEGFKPEIHEKKDRQLITFEGGPAYDRTFAGMFNQGRKLEVNEDEIRAFRASMVEGLGGSGGFSVPDQLAAKWLDDALPNEIVRPRATVWPMTSATRDVPGWDGADQSSSLYGGFWMEFLAEEGTGSKQTGKLKKISLEAKKGAIFVDASSELVEDGLGFEAQLEMAVKKSLALGFDYYFLQGVGAGQPLGVLNADSIVTVDKESGQAADTVLYENVIKMFARMYPAGRSKAVWIANETCIPQLLGMSIDIGTGGSLYQVINEKNGQFSIFGRPVIFSPSMPELGNANDIIFADLSQYAIGLRREMKLEKSNIPGWTEDLVSYRVLVRMDGLPTWDQAITPRNGDDLSWVVGLAERS